VTTTRPLPDSTFDVGVANKYDIAPQHADAAARTLAAEVHRLTSALGVESTEAVGTIAIDGGDPVDEAVVADGLDLRTSLAVRRHRDLSVFLITGRHYDGADVRGRHQRLLVQRGEVSVCEMVVSTSPRRVLAGRDPAEVDTVHVRLTSGLDTVLGAPLTAIVEALRVPPPLELDPDADLVGVDLGGGRIVCQANDTSGIEWDLQPTSADEVRTLLGKYIAQCFSEFQLGPVPQLETATTRSWNCSGGAEPPDCPFSDLTRSVGRSADGRVRVTMSSVQAHWSTDDVDHVSVTLDMRTATDRLRVVAAGRTGTADCTTLRVNRPTSGAAVEALWHMFASRRASSG
jgi:hypothetical protein